MGEADVMISTLNVPLLKGALIREINEQYLLHGTSDEALGGIMKQGIDSRLAGRALFGQGSYFCESSTKADQYAGTVSLLAYSYTGTSILRSPIQRYFGYNKNQTWEALLYINMAAF